MVHPPFSARIEIMVFLRSIPSRSVRGKKAKPEILILDFCDSLPCLCHFRSYSSGNGFEVCALQFTDFHFTRRQGCVESLLFCKLVINECFLFLNSKALQQSRIVLSDILSGKRRFFRSDDKYTVFFGHFIPTFVHIDGKTRSIFCRFLSLCCMGNGFRQSFRRNRYFFWGKQNFNDTLNSRSNFRANGDSSTPQGQQQA